MSENKKEPIMIANEVSDEDLTSLFHENLDNKIDDLLDEVVEENDAENLEEIADSNMRQVIINEEIAKQVYETVLEEYRRAYGNEKTEEELQEMAKAEVERIINEEVERIEFILNDTSGFFTYCNDVLRSLNNYAHYKIEPVPPSEMGKISMKKLVQKFENPDFKDLPQEEILKLCKEMTNKVTRQISSVPQTIDSQELGNAMMCTYTGLNNISVNFNSLFKEDEKKSGHLTHPADESGLIALYSILHEIYHTKQGINAYNFLNGKPYEDEAILSVLQAVVVDHVMDQNLDEDTKYMLYSTDLMEVNANIFAIRTMERFVERGYFEKPKKAEHFINKMKFYYTSLYNNKFVNMSHKVYKENLHLLSYIKSIPDNQPLTQNDKVIFDTNAVDNLKWFYDTMRGAKKEMYNYKAGIKDKIIELRQELSGYVLGKSDEELNFLYE